MHQVMAFLRFLKSFNFLRLQMSERSILSRLATSASASSAGSTQVTPAGQFPAGFQQGQLPGVFGVNFAQFRPQYSIPGQSSAFPGTAPPENTAGNLEPKIIFGCRPLAAAQP